MKEKNTPVVKSNQAEKIKPGNKFNSLIQETKAAYVKVLLSKQVGLFSLITFNWNF